MSSLATPRRLTHLCHIQRVSYKRKSPILDCTYIHSLHTPTSGPHKAQWSCIATETILILSQVLRYCFQEGAEPLWPSPHPVPKETEIPPCQHCSGSRRFEFQAHCQLLWSSQPLLVLSELLVCHTPACKTSMLNAKHVYLSEPRCKLLKTKAHISFLLSAIKTDKACLSEQVMPQLLSSLGIDDEQETALDWGTIALYSCAASCSTQQAYVEEFVWVQP